jgi:hypothetical protein
MSVKCRERFKAAANQEEATMNTVTLSETVATPALDIKQPQPKQSAKEAIAENIKLLIQQLEQGHSEALTGYLTAMGRFHDYSFRNIMEIARQMPQATHIAGFHAWRKLCRFVKKGEHGIRIYAPMVGGGRRKESEGEGARSAEEEGKVFGYRAVYVFDISQTEGDELPEISTRVTGEVGDYRQRLEALVISQGIALEYSEAIAPAFGISYGGRIALLPGQPEAEEFATLIHELAHEMMHKSDQRKGTTKITRETEAESVAFVVCKTIGLNAGRASADYIHLYNGDAAVLAESLEAIQRTAAVILSALETDAPAPDSEATYIN